MKTTITAILLVASFVTLTACGQQETTPAVAPAPAVAPTAVQAPETNPANEALNHFKATNQSQGKTYKNPKF